MKHDLFYNMQTPTSKEKYKELLSVTGSMSRLYSDSINPFLYYRAMENIFCACFDADDLSRSDVSVDAIKDKIGIGLKTFLHSNGNTFQKIAEFNKESYLLNNLSDHELALKVSKMRNERIRSTKVIYDLDSIIYHYVTRAPGRMNIYEETMNYVNLDEIIITKTSPTTVRFFDGSSEYNFNKSKSTLLKRICTTNLELLGTINIEIMKNPFQFLLEKSAYNDPIDLIPQNVHNVGLKLEDYIVLPLYSERTGEVEKKSGLNMWNAAGRARHPDEVYIPIPSWIHKNVIDFFKYKNSNKNTDSFKVKLPNKRLLSMKVTQAGGKALQSDPNKELGKWILRDILELPRNQLVTKKDLDEIGIDSVKLTKISDDYYKMDFLKVGSYEEFKENRQQ